MPISDFDFLPGRWHVANRRLVDTLDPACAEWEEFEATSEAQAILGGAGNMDQFHVPATGYRGYSLRLYDPAADVWRIWWASTARPGRLDPPVEGRFLPDGTARFECEDELEADSARWDQFFSFDDGENWVPNWTMWLSRASLEST